MSDFVFSRAISNHRRLYISPLPDKDIEPSMPLSKTNRLSYYLYEMGESLDDDDITVLAKLVSEDAALRLRDVLQMEYT